MHPSGFYKGRERVHWEQMGWKKIKVQKIFTTLRDTWENVIVVS